MMPTYSRGDLAAAADRYELLRRQGYAGADALRVVISRLEADLPPAIDPLKLPRRYVSPAARQIVEAVAARNSIDVRFIAGKSRRSDITAIRQEAAWELRRARFSFPNIAAALGMENHTSAIAAVAKHEMARAALAASAERMTA